MEIKSSSPPTRSASSARRSPGRSRWIPWDKATSPRRSNPWVGEQRQNRGDVVKTGFFTKPGRQNRFFFNVFPLEKMGTWIAFMIEIEI